MYRQKLFIQWNGIYINNCGEVKVRVQVRRNSKERGFNSRTETSIYARD